MAGKYLVAHSRSPQYKTLLKTLFKAALAPLPVQVSSSTRTGSIATDQAATPLMVSTGCWIPYRTAGSWTPYWCLGAKGCLGGVVGGFASTVSRCLTTSHHWRVFF